MNRKTLAISIALLTTLAAVVGALTVTALTAADTTPTPTATNTVTNRTTTTSTLPPFGGYMINQGFGGRCGRGFGELGGMGMNSIEVSTDYTNAVKNILGNDTDVANLISQGYNITAIHPQIHSIVQADGTITTNASTAAVLLVNGTLGYSIVNVDVANAKVTYIDTITRTVIDKSSS